MIIIADTSPVNYLLLIGEIEILPQLYGRVIIPSAVLEELSAKNAPELVKNWLLTSPEWLEIRNVSNVIETELAELLDAGEREAIQIAGELGADLLIIDEKLGREIAVRRGLRIVGTIGVLAMAGERNLINVEKTTEKLENTNIHVSSQLKEFLRKSKKH